MSQYYFAYGSNMNPERMRSRGLVFSDVFSGTLHGYELLFNKRAADAPGRAYANIGLRHGARTEGVLYRLQDQAEIIKMDPFEGAPRFYSREIFSIASAQGAIHAWVYVANPAMICHQVLPEPWYLKHLLAGRPYLSADYWQGLQQVKCYVGEPTADA